MPKKNVIEEMSINDINYELLKKQFPHAVSVDEEGKYSIDPGKLQMSLDPSKANIREDGYGLNWVGKKEAYHSAFSKNYKVLKPLNDDNSKNWDTTENILIKGDNLDALKILRQNYFECIKMIYIDPPYNTKNDGFVYNDNFTSSTEETLEELGYDKEYVEYIENIQGAKTHSGWLSFMYPRLLLARDLLKDDGVIFISIDDHSVAQLKLLCDEVFGAENFINKFVWKKNSSGKTVSEKYPENIDYIYMYSKSDKYKLQKIYKPLAESSKKMYSKDDEDGRGKYATVSLQKTGNPGPQTTYDYIDNTGKTWECPAKGWRLIKEKIKILENDNRLYFSGNTLREKDYWNERDNEGQIADTLWDDIAENNVGTAEVNKLLANEVFTNPKPTDLIKRCMKIITKKDDLILDFFAGSGTTAHAVIDLNNIEKTNRKFILVQLPELLSQKKNKKSYDFVKNELKKEVPSIFDITQERIKRAGEKIGKGDTGFRTFEIVEDTKQKIYQKSLEEMTQDDLLAFTQNTVESSEDILYNLLVAESLPLSTKIQTLIKEKLYLASNVAFVLGNVSIDELIAKLKAYKELEYITIYSPNISDDKFTLECESAVSSIGITSDKLRFRG